MFTWWTLKPSTSLSTLFNLSTVISLSWGVLKRKNPSCHHRITSRKMWYTVNILCLRNFHVYVMNVEAFYFALNAFQSFNLSISSLSVKKKWILSLWCGAGFSLWVEGFWNVRILHVITASHPDALNAFQSFTDPSSQRTASHGEQF